MKYDLLNDERLLNGPIVLLKHCSFPCPDMFYSLPVGKVNRITVKFSAKSFQPSLKNNFDRNRKAKQLNRRKLLLAKDPRNRS